MAEANRSGFDEFVGDLQPRLLRAFIGARGSDAADAVAEAMAYAWEHWERIQEMTNPAGYLYRVGLSRTRRRRQPTLPEPSAVGAINVEPGLVPALLALPAKQRAAVWLVHACGWSYAEVATALGTSVSMVGNHTSRGLRSLRRELGEP